MTIGGVIYMRLLYFGFSKISRYIPTDDSQSWICSLKRRLIKKGLRTINMIAINSTPSMWKQYVC